MTKSQTEGKMFCPRCHKKMKPVLNAGKKSVEMCYECGTAYTMEKVRVMDLPSYCLSIK